MGQRAEPCKGTVVSVADDVQSMVEGLKTEIEEWKDSLESNEMEHLPKYEEVSECFYTLEAVEEVADEIVSIIEQLPEGTQRAEVTFVQDTRKKATSRSYQFGVLGVQTLLNVIYMISGLRMKVEDLTAYLEAEDDLSEADEEVLNTLREVYDAIDRLEAEGDNVCFPVVF